MQLSFAMEGAAVRFGNIVPYGSTMEGGCVSICSMQSDALVRVATGVPDLLLDPKQLLNKTLMKTPAAMKARRKTAGVLWYCAFLKLMAHAEATHVLKCNPRFILIEPLTRQRAD